jgi:hypothetical protein
MGRKLPLNDWEGDDYTPGANAKYVTCLDTATGRAVCFATNGRVCKDGRTYRASITHDPDGITLYQAKMEIAAVAHLPLIIPVGWSRANVLTHLRYARGLVVTGLYSTIPRAFRYQLGADFGHGMFFSHMSVATGNFRGWDPLNPDTTAYGRWYPADVFWAFINSYNFAVGYVPLQSL